jgi:predicted P-loop ATPase
MTLTRELRGSSLYTAICCQRQHYLRVPTLYPLALKITLLHRWLLSAVAAALRRGSFSSRGVLTLQGPQGCGKTSRGRALIPDRSLQAEVFKDDHHLDGANKDSVLGAIRHWITEIEELDSSFKKDIARLKGFLTSNYDKLRPPYARTEAEYPRQTVFFATVNEFNFLIDPTGNTRWWTIRVKQLNFKHGIDMQQVFAQLVVELEENGQWWLTAAEEAQLAAWNVRHQSVSVIREKVLEFLDLDRTPDGSDPRMTALELLNHVGVQAAPPRPFRLIASTLFLVGRSFAAVVTRSVNTFEASSVSRT